MSTFKLQNSDYIKVDIEGKQRRLLSNAAFLRFNPSLLGLGELNQASTATDAMAAVFDLEGFTNFCKQIDPHLSVPLFLSEFLEWLLNKIKEEMNRKTFDQGIALWSPLPFFVKFMGDGLLVLWDVSKSSDVARRNIIVSAHQICKNYSKNFYPKLRTKVVEPPSILRCGLARGIVYSVGDGNDYVGSCINMAARLQKLSGTTFVFNRRGINLEDDAMVDFFKTHVVVKEITVRGIGGHELVCILKKEFEEMKPDDKNQFRAV